MLPHCVIPEPGWNRIVGLPVGTFGHGRPGNLHPTAVNGHLRGAGDRHSAPHGEPSWGEQESCWVIFAHLPA